MNLLKRILLTIHFGCFWKHVFSYEPIVVQYVRLETGFGSLLGTVETVELAANSQQQTTLNYHAYRGLRYAYAPVGKFRWRDPNLMTLPNRKNYLYDATNYGSQCPQWIRQATLNDSKVIGSEDCLFADVYVPLDNNGNPYPGPLKIMVFFHGGGFIVNANKDAQPLPLLHYADQPVIVVMFNYRISIFGYLSTGTAEMPGNYGPLDQIALLKWVQLFGKDFNGDTNDVTLFSSSIGSVSIHYLLLSNLASGLFHRVIMQSGSAYCERSMVENPLDIARKLGSYTGCNDPDPVLLSTCLRSKPTLELMYGAYFLTEHWSLPSILGPVVDGGSRPVSHQFLPNYPELLPVVNKVPVIAGITREEGLTAFVKISETTYTNQEFSDLEFIRTTILPRYLNLIMRVRKNQERNVFIERLSNEVMNVYRDEFIHCPISTLVGILGDLWINSCHRKTIEKLCVSNVPVVYAYLFTQQDFHISPTYLASLIEKMHEAGIHHPILDYGVAHTIETMYLLSKKATLDTLNHPRNVETSKMLSSLWTKFAYSKSLYYDSPNSKSKIGWAPICGGNFTDPALRLQELNLDSERIFPYFRFKETQFWSRIHKDTFLT